MGLSRMPMARNRCVTAALCGIYGIRTTHGRVDTKGAMDMSPSFDTVGWLAATPGVFRKVGTVLLGGAPVAAPVNHLLIADDGFIEADDAVSSLLRDALVAMADVLPHPQHIQIAPNGLDPWRDAIRLLQAYEIWQVYGRFIEEKRPRFGPSVSERMQVAAKITTLTGKPVTYVNLPFEVIRKSMLDQGMPQWQANALVELQEYYAGGKGGATDGLLKSLLGRAPITMDQYLAENKAEFGPPPPKA